MATVNVHITDTADDGNELPGVFYNTGAVQSGAFGGLQAWAFLRFLAVTGPVSGATINSATITLEVTDVSGSPDTTFYGVDADDPAQFADPGNLPSAATQTTANAAGPTATGSQQVNVASIVQEIVNRAGWASGNDMAFVCEDNLNTGTNVWAADDLDDTTEAVLDIDYTNPGATTRRYSLSLTGVG